LLFLAELVHQQSDRLGFTTHRVYARNTTNSTHHLNNGES